MFIYCKVTIIEAVHVSNGVIYIEISATPMKRERVVQLFVMAFPGYGAATVIFNIMCQCIHSITMINTNVTEVPIRSTPYNLAF